MFALVGFFAAGIRMRDVTIRQAAIGMMAITLIKACLFDAPAAGGLFKVVRFLARGRSLLVIGWRFQTYSRQSFDDPTSSSVPDEPPRPQQSGAAAV
jgi:uncharacterized membrane protein